MTCSKFYGILLLSCFRLFNSAISWNFFTSNAQVVYKLASSYCSIGYELAILDNEADTIAANDILRLNGVGGKVWFSLSFANGSFQWHDGTLLSNWTFWKSGEPDSDPVANNLECVSIDTGKDYQWASQSCTKSNEVLCSGQDVTNQIESRTIGVTTMPPDPGYSSHTFVRTREDARFLDSYVTYEFRSKVECAIKCTSTEGCSTFAFSQTGECDIVIYNATNNYSTVGAFETSIWGKQ